MAIARVTDKDGQPHWVALASKLSRENGLCDVIQRWKGGSDVVAGRKERVKLATRL